MVLTLLWAFLEDRGEGDKPSKEDLIHYGLENESPSSRIHASDKHLQNLLKSPHRRHHPQAASPHFFAQLRYATLLDKLCLNCLCFSPAFFPFRRQKHRDTSSRSPWSNRHKPLGAVNDQSVTFSSGHPDPSLTRSIRSPALELLTGG